MPRLSAVNLSGLTDGERLSLTAGESYDRLRLAGIALSDSDLTGATFSECQLTGWELRDVRLSDLALLECQVSGMFATTFPAPRAILRQVEFDDARIGAIEFVEAKVLSVRFRASCFGFVNLRGADLRDVLFVDCEFDGLDLGDARATRVSFEGCRVGDLDLTRAAMNSVDLRGVEIGRITGLDGVRGVTMRQLQAVALCEYFAAHLWISVTD